MITFPRLLVNVPERECVARGFNVAANYCGLHCRRSSPTHLHKRPPCAATSASRPVYECGERVVCQTVLPFSNQAFESAVVIDSWSVQLYCSSTAVNFRNNVITRSKSRLSLFHNTHKLHMTLFSFFPLCRNGARIHLSVIDYIL